MPGSGAACGRAARRSCDGPSGAWLDGRGYWLVASSSMFGQQRRGEAESLERIVGGATWEEFCNTLKMAGAVILRESSPRDPLTRSEGFRYLSRVLRAGL